MKQSRLDAGNLLTREHIATVKNIMMSMITDLLYRASVHDDSKLVAPEAEVFAEFGPKLKETTYDTTPGSVYMGFLGQMKPALDHHYANNSHHPEHVPFWKCPECESVFRDDKVIVEENPSKDEGSDEFCLFCPTCETTGNHIRLESYVTVDGMNLLDLVEMFCDWKAATMRHADGDISRSITQNTERFSLSPQLAQIFQNTVNLINSAATHPLQGNASVGILDETEKLTE
jgi:hypothetical protein